MTTTRDYTIRPLPTDDADCIALMIDALRDCAEEITATLPHLAMRFGMITDTHDYLPAATGIADAIARAYLGNDYDTPRDALAALCADDDFCADCMTADFSTPLFDLIHYADESLND